MRKTKDKCMWCRKKGTIRISIKTQKWKECNDCFFKELKPSMFFADFPKRRKK
jgi:hypothetical protein